ncbi:hypothetical protein HZS_3405 [Henneguya salminicola]|nr:hypothetical protein HZS_3405 [Henneguya salminicola]
MSFKIKVKLTILFAADYAAIFKYNAVPFEKINLDKAFEIYIEEVLGNWKNLFGIQKIANATQSKKFYKK